MVIAEVSVFQIGPSVCERERAGWSQFRFEPLHGKSVGIGECGRVARWWVKKYPCGSKYIDMHVISYSTFNGSWAVVAVLPQYARSRSTERTRVVVLNIVSKPPNLTPFLKTIIYLFF